MTKKILSVLAMGALSAVLLFGDTTPPAPPSAADMIANQVARLTKLLTLTTAQRAQATTIFTTEQTAMDALRTPMDTARTALDTAVHNNKGINDAALSIGSLTAQQVYAQATADAAFYAILTADQKTVYDELKAAGLGGPPPQPGPGGPGGPGPRH